MMLIFSFSCRTTMRLRLHLLLERFSVQRFNASWRLVATTDKRSYQETPCANYPSSRSTPRRATPHRRRNRNAVHAAGRLRCRAAAGAGQPEALPGQRPQGRLRGPAGPHRGRSGPLRGPRLRTRRRPARSASWPSAAPAGSPRRSGGVKYKDPSAPGHLHPAGIAGGVGVGEWFEQLLASVSRIRLHP